MAEEQETYKVLDYKQFFSKYKDKNIKECKFLNKSYSETGNSVALYPDSLDKDCYFQLPDFGEDVVPSDRRYIYFLPANSYKDIPHKVGVFSNGLEKVSIGAEHLKIWGDPYTNLKDVIITKTREEKLIGSLRELIKEYDEGR